jgi:hypothetical protein
MVVIMTLQTTLGLRIRVDKMDQMLSTVGKIVIMMIMIMILIMMTMLIDAASGIDNDDDISLTMTILNRFVKAILEDDDGE